MAVLLIAAVGAMGCAHAAEVYRWVDENGRVHYSDRPVGNAEKINVKASSAAAPAPAPAQQPKNGAPASQGQPQSAAADKAADCEHKKQQLEKYRTAPRIIEMDALGKEKEYTLEDKRKLIEKAERDYAKDCAGG